MSPKIRLGWSPWVNLQQFDITYGVPPKNASSSFFEALRRHYDLKRTKGVQFVDNPHVCKSPIPLYEAFFVVRHPLDRFESLWRSKCRDGHGTIGGHPVRGLTPEELFAYIQEHPEDDPHWRRQTSLLGNVEGPQPILLPVDHFAEHFLSKTGIEMWQQNPTHGECPMTLELMTDVMEHYEADLFLYERSIKRWEAEHEKSHSV